MSLAAWEKDQARKLQIRRRILQHHEQVTHNVSKTCRFFGVSRSQFYIWLRRYRQLGDLGLRDRPPGPRVSPLRTPPHIEALVLQLRRERRYGAVRLSLYLQRYYQVYLSPPTILRILREHHMPKVSWKRYRPRPRRRPELRIPGQSVQVDVKAHPHGLRALLSVHGTGRGYTLSRAADLRPQLGPVRPRLCERAPEAAAGGHPAHQN